MKKESLPDIDFEGITVKPRGGYYRCPFQCSDPRYPQRKWKTEKGFRAHMAVCSNSPAALKRYEAETKMREQELKIKKDEALKKVSQKIGDKIYYVREIIEKPTHVWRGNRQVKVRYEAVMRFEAREDTIKEIDYVPDTVILNKNISISSLCESISDARIKAAARQKSYDEHVKLSEMCR